MLFIRGIFVSSIHTANDINHNIEKHKYIKQIYVIIQCSDKLLQGVLLHWNKRALIYIYTSMIKKAFSVCIKNFFYKEIHWIQQ